MVITSSHVKKENTWDRFRSSEITYTPDSSPTDESRTPPMPTAMSNITGPPPHCPSKRKYGEEQMDDRINCDDDHMTKMSRLFATQL